MHLTCVTLYPTPMCQLDCVFCSLTKIPSLSTIDEQFAKSYEDKGYYTRQLLNLGWENIKDIHRIEFWGGEPTLRMHRTYDTVRDFIELLPIDSVFFSTNLCYSKVEDEIRGLIEVLGEYPDRRFQVQIQLSLDGPKDVTDPSRGENVTEMFLNNFNKLCKKAWYSNIFPNVNVRLTLKPTLSTEHLKKFLDIDYMEYYFRWIETNIYDVIQPYLSNKLGMNKQCIPNIAVPMEASKQDGLDFAQICKNAFWLSVHGHFKYYKNIVMFARYERFTNRNCIAYCGAGRSVVELLPGGKYCACHRAFLTYLEEYRDSTKRYSDIRPLEHRELETSDSQIFVFDTAQEFLDFCERVEQPKSTTSSFFVQQGMIRYLAKLGQIDSKYQDPKEAHRAANMFTEYANTCLYDNFTTCASQMLELFSSYRMFLNGAIDVIYLATERVNVLDEESRL